MRLAKSSTKHNSFNYETLLVVSMALCQANWENSAELTSNDSETEENPSLITCPSILFPTIQDYYTSKGDFVEKLPRRPSIRI